MTAQYEKANNFRLELLQNFADREKITERLRHFFVVDAHESIVHPIVDEGLAGCALALRNLVFVMGKLQVRTAAVNIEMFAQ